MSSITSIVTATAPAVCANCSNELDKDMPSTLGASKDTRAYEFSRQRAHKAEEQARAKGRKDAKLVRKAALGAAAAATPSTVRYNTCSCCRVEKGTRRMGKTDLKPAWEREVGDDGGPPSPRTPGPSPMLGMRVVKGVQPTEVNLADLFTASKKTRKSKGEPHAVPNECSSVVLTIALLLQPATSR